MLQGRHRGGGPDMVLAAHAHGVFAADVEHAAEHRRVAECVAMTAHRLFGDFGEAHAFDPGRGAGEVLVDEACLEADGGENLRAAIRLIGRDAHLGHHLEQPLVDRLDVALDDFFLVDLARQLGVHRNERFERQIRVDGFGAVAGEAAEMVHLARLCRLDHDPDRGAKPLTDQVMVHGGAAEQRRHRHAVGAGLPVGQDDNVDAAVHHHLIRQGLRTSVGLVVESAEPREVHHFGCLAGYGAEAINPYLAFETLIAMHAELPGKLDKKEIVKRYIKAIDKGLLKVMSKMGISTYQSYCGAQIFDAVGLKAGFVNKYFTGTATRIEGVGLSEIAEEAVRRHRDAFGDSPVFRGMLDVGGEYAVRVRGEDHVWTATTVSTLQHAVRGNSQEKYRAFAKILNEQDTLVTIRGLFRVKTAEEDERKPVPIDEVEPAKTIVRRF